MIEAIQFDIQFSRLCAAFGTTKPDRTKDLWFEEFEGCDYFAFCRAIKHLQRGDKFPNWGVVWGTYKSFLRDCLEHKTKENEGCDNCEKGKVYYADLISCGAGIDGKTPFEYISYNLVANCAVCSSGILNGAVDIWREKLQDRGYGEYFTNRALKALPGELERIDKLSKERYGEGSGRRFKESKFANPVTDKS